MDQDLRYPIGKFERPETITESQRRAFIDVIAEAPVHLVSAVAHLTPAQLDTPYRPGGWTVRQLAHHIPDSHMNAYVRFKLALTESEPTIKPYDEARWAELPDGCGDDACRDLARSARESTQALGRSPALAHVRRLGAQVPASRAGRHVSRSESRALRLARQAPRGAHHRSSRAQRLALSVRLAYSFPPIRNQCFPDCRETDLER